MNICRFSVHRPIFTSMLVIIVVILGLISLFRLPIDLMPDVTSPTISISTEYENAGPEEIETLITRPIEEAISAVPGVQEVTSTSSEGNSNVRVTFAWGSDIDVAAADCRDRLDRVVGRIPPDADKPVLRKFDTSSIPVMVLGITGSMRPVDLRKLVEDDVKYRLERVKGVASVDIRGGLTREIHVALDPDKIKALGLSLDLILAKIRAENVNVPGGTIEKGNYDLLIRTPGEFTSLTEIENTIVTMRQGSPVRLRDVSNVKDAWQRETRVVKVNGQNGLRVAISKQSGTNTVEVAEAAKKEIEKIKADMPQIKIVPILDSSEFIRQSIQNVGYAAWTGGILAVFVLIAILRNIRTTSIVATSIPLSIIATFTMMYFSGMTLNIMTLGGLALGVGMLVDNAIVVIENIFRLREEGMAPDEAAVQGSGEVAGAVIASTLTTIVVFLPLVFVRGMAGIMFKQLALVVTFSLVCSLVVALTFVPMLGAKIVKTPKKREELGPIMGLLSDAFDTIDLFYKHVLQWALHNRGLVIVGAVVILALSVGLIKFVGTELVPKTDEAQVNITIESEVGTKLSELLRLSKRVEDIVAGNVPEAKQSVVSIGGGGMGGPHSGGAANRTEIQVSLVKQAERTRSSEQIADDLRKKLNNIPGVIIRTRAAQNQMMRRMAGSTEPVQVEIRGHNFQVADQLAQKIKKVVESVPGVTDAAISRDSGTPEELLIIDRQKAATLKLTVSQIANVIETCLSGTTACYYREEGDEYPIIVKVNDSEHMKLEEILDLTILNSDNEQVMLRNVVSLKPTVGPMFIERKDQERIITITANIFGRDVGSVTTDVQNALKTVPVPSDFSVTFAGDYEDKAEAFRELLVSMVLALILVYMVMACQYESLRDPFVVMFSVPFAIIGVVVMLLMTNTTFNMQSYIGCIMLGGIVVNNAIVLVDYTNLLRHRDKMPLLEAIAEAGRRRLRPIVMTAATTILGLIPLAIGAGEGGEQQAPMARAVLGGLLSSTIITLVLVPVVYYYAESLLGKKDEVVEEKREEVSAQV